MAVIVVTKAIKVEITV